MQAETKYEYHFADLDKRAIIGLLLFENFYKNLAIVPVKSQEYPIETLVIKGPEVKAITGVFSIISFLNPKLSKTSENVELLWKIAYQLTQLHVVIDKKKKTTTLKINSVILNEIKLSLTKNTFIQGKALSEVDLLAYINLSDNIEKNLEHFNLNAPSVTKWYTELKQKLGPQVESFNQIYPKQKAEDKSKEEVKEGQPAADPKDKKKEVVTPKPDANAPKKEGKEKTDKKEVLKSGKAAPAKPIPAKAKPKEPLVDPETQAILNQCKIRRLNKGAVLTPHPTKKNVLITSALPYVNNVPHLGNIIGCVLSADVFARYARLRGYNTLYICGTDEYGTATETKALLEKVTPKEICDKYFQIHKEIYEWFDIDFDHFGRTTTDHQTKIAQEIFLNLHEKKLLSEDILEQPYCEGCKRFLADRFIEGICPNLDCKYADARGDQCDSCGRLLDAADLIDPKCKICGTKPIIKKTKHIFLDLPAIKDDLEKWKDKSSTEGFWSSNSIQITNGWIKQGLKQRCITRDLKWGTPVPLPGYEDKVFYVWFDAPIGYISITANYTKDWEKWWKNPENVKLYQFMGKDNIPFHTVIFPCTLIGTREPWTLLHHVSTTEYLNYESGKFSKSRGVGVFGDNSKETLIASEVWRYYLLINRPEQSDTEFNWEDFAAKNNNELLANLGNMINRALKFIYAKFDQKVPNVEVSKLNERDHELLQNVWTKFQEYLTLFEAVEIKTALKTAMEISRLCNGYLQAEKPWEEENFKTQRSNVVLFVIANLIRLISTLTEPFIPSFSAKVNYILGLKRTEKDETLLEYLALAGKYEALLELLPPNQKLEKPVPLFAEITPDDVNLYRSKYSGQDIAAN